MIASLFPLCFWWDVIMSIDNNRLPLQYYHGSVKDPQVRNALLRCKYTVFLLINSWPVYLKARTKAISAICYPLDGFFRRHKPDWYTICLVTSIKVPIIWRSHCLLLPPMCCISHWRSHWSMSTGGYGTYVETMVICNILIVVTSCMYSEPWFLSSYQMPLLCGRVKFDLLLALHSQVLLSKLTKLKMDLLPPGHKKGSVSSMHYFIIKNGAGLRVCYLYS